MDVSGLPPPCQILPGGEGVGIDRTKVTPQEWVNPAIPSPFVVWIPGHDIIFIGMDI